MTVSNRIKRLGSLFLPFLFVTSGWAQMELDPNPQLEWVLGGGEGANYFMASINLGIYQKMLNRKWDLKLTLSPTYALYKSTPPDIHREVRDISLTPVFTFYKRRPYRAVTPIVGIGVGFHYLNQKGVAAKDFSTNFQFGDHISFGIAWGPYDRYKLTYAFQHLSNGGIASPNPGINFHLMTMGVKLRQDD